MVEFGMGSAVRRKFCLWLQGGAPVGGGLVRGARGKGEPASSIQMRLTHPPAAEGRGGQNRFQKKRLLFKHSCLWCSVLPVLPWKTSAFRSIETVRKKMFLVAFLPPPGLEYGRLSKRGEGLEQPYGLIRPPCHWLPPTASIWIGTPPHYLCLSGSLKM